LILGSASHFRQKTRVSPWPQPEAQMSKTRHSPQRARPQPLQTTTASFLPHTSQFFPSVTVIMKPSLNPPPKGAGIAPGAAPPSDFSEIIMFDFGGKING